MIENSVKRPRVVYWFDRPTPTPMERCNAVARLGAFDFEVWFNRRDDGGAFQKWEIAEDTFEVPYRYVEPMRIFGRKLAIPASAMTAVQPDLIVQDYWPWHMAVGTLASKASARRTALRVLPNYDSWSHRTKFGEISKNFIFRAVDGAKASGVDATNMAACYGLPSDRISIVTQSIDASRFNLGPARVATRDALRGRLGLNGCTFLFVGRLWTGKGLDYLLDAYGALSAAREDVSLVLVGDGPDEARYRERSAHLKNVFFVGWVERELADYFAACDVFVFPTLGDPNGLVVEEAMAAGMPVISSDAAGDIHARIKQPERGYVVARADAKGLEGRMRELAGDPELRRQMGAAGAAYADEKNHDRYARDFVAFAERQLALPARRSFPAVAARAGGWVLLVADRLMG